MDIQQIGAGELTAIVAGVYVILQIIFKFLDPIINKAIAKTKSSSGLNGTVTGVILTRKDCMLKLDSILKEVDQHSSDLHILKKAHEGVSNSEVSNRVEEMYYNQENFMKTVNGLKEAIASLSAVIATLKVG